MSEEEVVLLRVEQRGNRLALASPAQKERSRWKIFLAWAADDVAEKRESLAVMLEKAGMDVFPRTPLPANETEATRLIQEYVDNADASIHVLGSQYGKSMIEDRRFSLARFQYLKAEDKARKFGGKFKRFVWNFLEDGVAVGQDQMEFLNLIQNSISEDMMFTVTENPTQFVEDVKTFLVSDNSRRAIPKEYDIAFLSNIQDAADCYETIEQLSAELKVTTLTIVPDKDQDYKTDAVDLVRKSQLVVVYFREASDWAISFSKMVWKQAGGASAKTPFLLIGEDDPRRNRFLKFNAPNLTLTVVPKAEVLDKINEGFKRAKETGQISDKRFCPYTGLRPFNEDESIFFKGRETHIQTILKSLEMERFSMVTGSSGDGKSSLIFAGVIPSMKGGFIKSSYTKWAVADFRPERTPLRNLSEAVSRELRTKTVEEVENALSYGFSALIDLYKESPLYCDVTSDAYLDATEAEQREMKKQAANLLILVDQFEEFFTNTENFRDGVASPVAQITINVLLETIRIAREAKIPIYVIFTMRSDYIGQCVAFRGFPELIGLSTYFVPRLKRDEIQEVVQAPAVLNGNRISSRLVQRILNDLGDGLDQLPVLQHCMHQIWTLADEGARELDLIHYVKVGGLAATKLTREDKEQFDAWFAKLTDNKKSLYDKPKLRNVLNRHANELYETAHDYYNKRYQPGISKEDAQLIMRVAFTYLTKIDENRAVRNRASLQQIASIINRPDLTPQIIGRLLNIFREPGNTFVQPYITDDPASRELPAGAVLDITHESLIRNWDKLVEWALQENKSVSVYQEFKFQVNRWLENNLSSKDLLNVGTFTYFNAWFEDRKPNAAWIRRYIRPDEIIPDMDLAEQSEQYLEDIQEFLDLSRQKIERNKRRVVFVIGVISVLFVFSMILAYLAQQQAQVAMEQKAIAESNAIRAEKEKIRAEINAREARKQKLEAERQTLIAQQNLIEAELQRTKAEDSEKRAKLQAELAEKNRQIADKNRQIAEEQTEIAKRQKREAEIQKELAEQATYQAKLSEAEALRQKEEARKQRDNALITQSYFLARLGEDQVEANNPEVGLLVAQIGLPRKIGDPNERPYVAQAEASLYYAANAIVNAKPTLVMEGHKNKMIFNQFSPDGSKLITTSWDKTARIWDTNTGQELGMLTGHTHIVSKAFFSEDGKYVISLGMDFSARLWDINAKQVTTVFRGHKTTLNHAAVSSDSKKVVTVSEDKTGILWDAMSGKKIANLEGHTAGVVFAAFSPDGKRLITTSKDKTARLWNGETGELIQEIKGHNDVVQYAAFSPDNRLVGTVSNDYNAFIWDGKTGAAVRNLRGHNGGIVHIGFDPSGKRIITSSLDGTAKVWETATGNLLGTLAGHTKTVYHAAFSSDNKHIVTTSADKSARVWDANSYLRLAQFDGHPALGYRAAFSPDGKKLAMAGPKFTVLIYKVLPNLQDLVDLSYEELKKRDLTPAERAKFFLASGEIKKEVEDELKRKQKEEAEKLKNLPVDKAAAIEKEPEGQTPNYETQTPKSKKGAEKANAEEAPSPAENKPTVKPEPQRYQAPANPNTIHIVRPGDSLWSIAKMYNVKVETLMELNTIPSTGIRPGMRLKIN